MLAWHPFWAASRAICFLAWGFALLNMTWPSSCLRMMYPVRLCRKLGVIAWGIWVDLSDYTVRRVGHVSQCVWHAVQVELDGPAPDGLSLENFLQVLSGQFSLELVGWMGGEVADGYLPVVFYHNYPS